MMTFASSGPGDGVGCASRMYVVVLQAASAAGNRARMTFMETSTPLYEVDGGELHVRPACGSATGGVADPLHLRQRRRVADSANSNLLSSKGYGTPRSVHFGTPFALQAPRESGGNSFRGERRGTGGSRGR